jgi:hypothetical protein
MAAPEGIRSNYADLVGSAMLPMLEEICLNEYAQHAALRDKLFKTVSTDTQIWQSSEVDDMPLFSSVSEGADYTMSRTKQGYDKTVSVVKYGLAANFSEELIADSKFGHMSDTVKKMGRSGRESQAVSAANILNNAFGSTTTPDGLALCHTAHTTPSGTVTFRNVLSTASDLSVSSLKTAVTDFRSQFKGDSGIIYDIKPKYLVVPMGLRLDAIQIVQSDLLAGTSNNDINSLKGEGLEVVASPHLTDDDAWFLISDSSENGLRIVNRQPFQVRASKGDYGFINDSVAVKAAYREALAAIHAKGVFGTAGAA